MRKLYLLLITGFLFSCADKKNNDGFITTKSNFEYKIIPAASGDAIQKGDVVKVHLTQFMDDSLMNDTRTGLPEYIKIDTTLREFDFSEILPLMKVNDSAICIFSTKEILKRMSPAEDYPPHFLEKGKNIKVHFKVVSKFTSDSLAVEDYRIEKQRFDGIVAMRENAGYEKAALAFDSLIKSIKSPLTKLPNGVYVHIIEKGKSGKIKEGDSVAVVYKGMLANGSVFEETTAAQPFVFRAGQHEAVEGFDTGIASLTYGDRAKIYIPARLAYGANKAGDNIPPFSNLVFELVVNKN